MTTDPIRAAIADRMQWHRDHAERLWRAASYSTGTHEMSGAQWHDREAAALANILAIPAPTHACQH